MAKSSREGLLRKVRSVAFMACFCGLQCHAPAQQDGSSDCVPPEYRRLPNLAHVSAPSPTELVNQLRSSEAQVRVEALKLVSVPPLFLTLKDQNGDDWTKASEARLLYGRYRDDGDLALVAIRLQKAWTFASVLLRTESRWKRIGLFSCWCKYEANPLEGFIEFRPVLHWPQTDILVHDSGGGSGVSGRTLNIFRIRNDRLEKIYSATDKVENCHPTENIIAVQISGLTAGPSGGYRYR